MGRAPARKVPNCDKTQTKPPNRAGKRQQERGDVYICSVNASPAGQTSAPRRKNNCQKDGEKTGKGQKRGRKQAKNGAETGQKTGKKQAYEPVQTYKSLIFREKCKKMQKNPWFSLRQNRTHGLCLFAFLRRYVTRSFTAYKHIAMQNPLQRYNNFFIAQRKPWFF
ncbi:MAG: hypothetical protein II970_01935 [Paludibacteraceae bacterium]|nr:hypothetical protein [Paludibacteraceae bacterium]